MIECGFFNSVDKDRTYSADEMGRPYELLVSNGVFATQNGAPSDYLQVYADNGMNVVVKPGRGIFKDKWLINNNEMSLTIDAAEVTLTRIDSVIVKIDTSESVRAGTIEIKKGTPASSPVAPTMERSLDIHEYRLANITIGPQVTEITQKNITDMRGSADCPWVTSLVQQVDTSTLLVQWQDAYQTYYAENEETFNTWFQEVKDTAGTLTLIRMYSGYHETTEESQTVIPIDMEQFNNALDILQVYINGLLAIEGVDYSIASIPAESITLLNPVDIGTIVSFNVIKSSDATVTDTMAQQVVDLETKVADLEERIRALENQ